MEFDSITSVKKTYILKGLEHSCDLRWLKEFCISQYGLVDNEVRKSVWPLLADVSNAGNVFYTEDELKAHSSYHQVDLDVKRLDSLLPDGMEIEDKDKIRQTMMHLIMSVLKDNPQIHYYQGFHDICYIFLSVLGESDARSVINKILPLRFGLFMEASMDGTIAYMQSIFALLGYLRPKLMGDLEAVGLDPHFALAWIVTWFAHVLPDMDDVRRLFDLFLATDPSMLIYLSVAVIIRSGEEVQSNTYDFGMLHHTLLRLPKKHPVEELVGYSIKLYNTLPPDRLHKLCEERFERIKTSSVKHKQPARWRWYLGPVFVAVFAYAVYWWIRS